MNTDHKAAQQIEKMMKNKSETKRKKKMDRAVTTDCTELITLEVLEAHVFVCNVANKLTMEIHKSVALIAERQRFLLINRIVGLIFQNHYHITSKSINDKV